MTRLFPIICCLVLAAACSSSSDNRNLRPRSSVNEAVTANLNLAIEYMRRGEYEIALEKMERARIADPDYYGTYNAFGLLYQQLGRNKQAETSYRKALSLNKSDSATMNNYGRLLCQTGKTRDAVKIFMQAADNPLYETPEVAIANAGTCLMLNGDTDTAENHFREALEINPRIPVALLSMSRISYDRQNYLSARGYLQRYAELQPHTADSLLLGIKIETYLEDRDAVSSYALRLRSNYPGSEQVKQAESMGIK